MASLSESQLHEIADLIHLLDGRDASYIDVLSISVGQSENELLGRVVYNYDDDAYEWEQDS